MTLAELLSIIIASLALLVAVATAIRGSRLAKRQAETDKAMLRIERAREHDRVATSKRAALSESPLVRWIELDTEASIQEHGPDDHLRCAADVIG